MLLCLLIVCCLLMRLHFCITFVITDMVMFGTVKLVFEKGWRQASCICLKYCAPISFHSVSERLLEFTSGEQKNKKFNIIPGY